MSKLPAGAQIWRGEKSIRGVKTQLTVAINQSTDGAYIQLDIKTARNLEEICNQAIRTEKGTDHE